MCRATTAFDPAFAYLFNSYYEGEGERHPRPKRGMLSRPSLDRVRDWRAHVDAALDRALPDLPPQALDLVELGINHEQQHQELFLTDILATFAENPLEPAYGELPALTAAAGRTAALRARAQEGLIEIGAPADGFAFDSERPRHAVLLHPHALADRTVTNGEWAEFIADGGYSTPTLWLSEGWDWVRSESVTAPLYWRGRWHAFHPRRPPRNRPVRAGRPCQLLRSRRLCALGGRPPAARGGMGIRRRLRPTRLAATSSTGPARSSPKSGGALFGDVWNWTISSFAPYPGFATGPRRSRRI